MFGAGFCDSIAWVNRAAQALAGLVAVFRNRNIRRLELAWGAAITAEWAHFVALGVFAYDAGGTAAVGIAGLVRLLPAALVAPFAASFGDRFRRERFLAVIALVGAAALAGSAVAFFVGENVPAIFALSAVVGLSATLVRPALQALLPSFARTPQELIGSNGATSTIESLGTLIGPFAGRGARLGLLTWVSCSRSAPVRCSRRHFSSGSSCRRAASRRLR